MLSRFFCGAAFLLILSSWAIGDPSGATLEGLEFQPMPLLRINSQTRAYRAIVRSPESFLLLPEGSRFRAVIVLKEHLMGFGEDSQKPLWQGTLLTEDKVADVTYTTDINLLVRNGFPEQSKVLFRFGPNHKQLLLVTDKDVVKAVQETDGIYHLCQQCSEIGKIGSTLSCGVCLTCQTSPLDPRSKSGVSWDNSNGGGVQPDGRVYRQREGTK
jgi:hypothetical protein